MLKGGMDIFIMCNVTKFVQLFMESNKQHFVFSSRTAQTIPQKRLCSHRNTEKKKKPNYSSPYKFETWVLHYGVWTHWSYLEFHAFRHVHVVPQETQPLLGNFP